MRLLLALLALLTASPARAWWEYGHRTVARIALAEARPATRAAVARLLARSALLETPQCPARSIAQASVWADCVKALGDRYSYAYAWHYQDIDICKPFDVKENCADGNCVTRQIDRNFRLLKDKAQPPRVRVEALVFLIHFVGDLHQPLHVGERGDQGGNQQPAAYGAIAGKTNLHTIWDGYLAERAISTPPGGARGLDAAITPAERARAPRRAGTTGDWARESWQAAHDFAYGAAMADPCGPKPARAVIDEATTRRLIPVAREQEPIRIMAERVLQCELDDGLRPIRGHSSLIMPSPTADIAATAALRQFYHGDRRSIPTIRDDGAICPVTLRTDCDCTGRDGVCDGPDRTAERA